jgi:hypothetical protein
VFIGGGGLLRDEYLWMGGIVSIILVDGAEAIMTERRPWFTSCGSLDVGSSHIHLSFSHSCI